jgi:putative transposase
MTKREQQRLAKENMKKLLLDTWACQKTQGTSLAEFCRFYGLSRKTFYRWLQAEGKAPTQPVHRVAASLKQKAVEIYLRYKGTWSAETIALALKGQISAQTIRRVINPYRKEAVKSPPLRAEPNSKRQKSPNHIWSIDWTQYKVRGKTFHIVFLIDEAARFCLGWEIFDRVPDKTMMTSFFKETLARYQGRPLLIKSDRAKVFRCDDWKNLLEAHGIVPRLSRPHCPQDQGAIERFIREAKDWLQACAPQDTAQTTACLDEGMFMLNFLKPKAVLNGKTPASAYLSARSLNPSPAISEALYV